MKRHLSNDQYIDRLRNNVFDVVCQHALWIKFSELSSEKRHFRTQVAYANTLRLINNAVASELIINLCALLEKRVDTVNFLGLVGHFGNALSTDFKALVKETVNSDYAKKLVVVRNNVLAHTSKHADNTWHQLRPSGREIWLAVTRVQRLYRLACIQIRGYDPPAIKTLPVGQRQEVDKFIDALVR